MAEFESGNLLLVLLDLVVYFFVCWVFLCLCSVIYLLLQHGRENNRERNRNSCNCVKTHITVRNFLELIVDPSPKMA